MIELVTNFVFIKYNYLNFLFPKLYTAHLWCNVKTVKRNLSDNMYYMYIPLADSEGGGGGVRPPPPLKNQKIPNKHKQETHRP